MAIYFGKKLLTIVIMFNVKIKMSVSSITKIIFVFVVSCEGQTGDDVKNVVTQLFTTNGYNKNVRPNVDQTISMYIDLDLFLFEINGIDEITQKLTTTGFVYIQWVDEYLQWDPSLYGNVFNIYVSQTDIWKPDIALQNGFTKLTELGGPFINVEILYTGDVTWMPSEIFETKCTIDTHYFLFDRHICDIVCVVWPSSIDDVTMTKGVDGIALDNLHSNGIWNVVSTSTLEDVESSESRVVFTIILERNSNYYVVNVIIPTILLGILNVFTFVIPTESGEKIGYSITVFLSFPVLLTIVSSELPKTSGSIL